MNVRRTRNDSRFWFCAYAGDTELGDTAITGDAVSGLSISGDTEENIRIIVDEYGNETGIIVPRYEAAVEMWANVSPAAGAAQFEQFGNMGNYDKVIVTRDMSCPIDENTVLFIDKEPEYTEVETHSIVDEDESETKIYRLPKYDYVVKRVARGLDAIAIAVRKVDVG